MISYRSFVTFLTSFAVLTASNAFAQSAQPGAAAQNLPESYYNSLKNSQINSGKTQTTTTQAAVSASAPTTQGQPITVAPNNTASVISVAPNNTASVIPVPPIVSVNETVPVKKTKKAKKKNEAPLAAEVDEKFIFTNIAQLKSEIEELQRKSSGSDVGKVAGYKGGFYLKSTDGKYKLQFNYRHQIRYSFNIAEDVEDGHTISIRRVFFFIKGHAFSEKASYFLLLTPLSTSQLLAYDLGYDFNEYIGIHATLDSLPNQVEVADSSGKLTFVSRSLVAMRYDVCCSVGVYATGGYKNFSYQVGIYNGFDSGLSANANNEMAYAVKFGFNIFGKMSSGMSDQAYSEKPAMNAAIGGIFGHYEDNSQARMIYGTGHLRFKFKGFAATVSGVYRQTDPDQFTQAQTDIGVAAFASYFIIPKKFEIGLRYAALFDDINDVGVNINMGAGNKTRLGGNLRGGDVGGDSDNEWEATLGMNYYIDGYNAKIQGEYSMVVDGIAGPDDLVNHIGMLQVMIGF